LADTEPKKVVKVQEVWDKFMEHDILNMVDKHLDALLSMRAIYIDCGINDQAGLIKDARKLHEKLNSLGIDHVYKEFTGDHICCVMTSTGDALEVFSKAMAFEMLPKVSVQQRGKLATTWGEMKRR
jgi:hypothetical protein